MKKVCIVMTFFLLLIMSCGNPEEYDTTVSSNKQNTDIPAGTLSETQEEIPESTPTEDTEQLNEEYTYLMQNSDESLVRYLQENGIDADSACIKDKTLYLRFKHTVSNFGKLEAAVLSIETDFRLNRLVTEKDSPYSVSIIKKWTVQSDGTQTDISIYSLYRRKNSAAAGVEVSNDTLENAIHTVFDVYENLQVTWTYNNGRTDITVIASAVPFDGAEAESVCKRIVTLSERAVSVISVTVCPSEEGALSAYCLYDDELGHLAAVGEFLK